MHLCGVERVPVYDAVAIVAHVGDVGPLRLLDAEEEIVTARYVACWSVRRSPRLAQECSDSGLE